METLNDVGILSLVPPLIAIILALRTKEVISSLLVGILSGTFIYSINTTSGFMNIFTKTIEITISLMTTKLADNGSIIIFLALLGALVVIVTKAGGSKAYGDWAVKKIKTKKGAKLSTFILGSLIFIDDYFNCLTVGTVMRPVTDKYKISREKLAYIIDSTAAPVCIIAPISSWAVAVISQISDTGINGVEAFIQAIPYNLYAILTLIMVLIICFTSISFGPMAKFENSTSNPNENNGIDFDDEELSKMQVSSKGKVIDLLIPIITLIVTSVLTMLYVGGYFEGGMTIAQGFGNTDAGPALAMSGFITILVTFILLVPRRIISFSEFMSSISLGVKSMVSAYIILVLAWSIGGVCRDLLNTGVYVGSLVENSNMASFLIPAISFIVSGLLAFAMGTSWGTFNILIPIVALICQNTAPDLMIISLSSVLAGSVFGDHCSPISDTTILSSTGAKCNHINHVSSQMPYTLVVAFSSFIGYIIAGITKNLILTLLTSFIVMILVIFIVSRKYKSKLVVK